MRLVHNWYCCHRWLSMRFLAAGVALQTAFIAMPEELRLALPDWVTRTMAIALLVCAVLGRLVDQGDKADG
jgi:hypothetical protein